MRVFDLEASLDDKTREMLQIYQPLIAQDIGLPEAGVASPPTVDTQDAPVDEQPKPPLPAEGTGEGEKEAIVEDERPINVLLVDDNEVNLRVCFPAMQHMCTFCWLQY